MYFLCNLSSKRVTTELRETQKTLISQSFWWLSLHLYSTLSSARYLITTIMAGEMLLLDRSFVFRTSILTSVLVTTLYLEINFVVNFSPILLKPLQTSKIMIIRRADLFSLGINIGEGNGTPLQYSCLENPMDGGVWWAAIDGVAKSQTQLRDFTFTFHFHAVEKEMATPLQCSCLESPRDGGAWWAAVSGVAQSRIQLKWLSSSSSSNQHGFNIFLLDPLNGSQQEQEENITDNLKLMWLYGLFDIFIYHTLDMHMIKKVIWSALRSNCPN